MKMTLFRKLLLVWMIAWLPAAGAMAVVMPLSGSMSMSAGSVAAQSGEQDQALASCHDSSATAKMSFGQGCKHCVLCHLAGALVMPEMPVIPTVVPTHLFTAMIMAIPPSFLPELASPPPRAALA